MESRISRWRASSLLCLLLAVVSPAVALSNAYCSSQNTGGELAQQSIYMSMGRCYDQCSSSYAFAIVQDDNCWCSNFIPADQVSTSECNTACPGFPDDLCGNSAKGLYGYVKLNIAASGTAGGSSTSTPARTTSTSSAGRTTSSSVPSSTQEITSSTESILIPISSQSETESTLPPTTSVLTVTQGGGAIVTQTVVSTPSTGANASLGVSQKSSGMSGGLIAAAVVASILGVALIGALAWFFLRRRRRTDDSTEKFGDINDDPSSPSNLNRNISTHSKAGLLDRGYAPTVATTTRMSRVSSTNGPEMASSSDAISPVTPSSERRSSRLVMYDQRLNPNSLMIIDNGSRTSLNTLDDHRDYGRMLKITNPDEAGSNRPSMSRQRSFQ